MYHQLRVHEKYSMFCLHPAEENICIVEGRAESVEKVDGGNGDSRGEWPNSLLMDDLLGTRW